MPARRESYSLKLQSSAGPKPAPTRATGSGLRERTFQAGLWPFGRDRARPVRARRRTTYRPTGEGLEPKPLLSDLLSWTGGNGGGNPNSPITPANIANLTEQYADTLDGAILPEPLSATVDVTVGSDQGTQTLVLAATANDSLYAINSTTGQIVWHTNFLEPGETTLPVAVIHTGVDGITSTPVIDPSINTIYLVTTECYLAGTVVHYTKTLHAVDMSDGTEQPGSPVVIANTGYQNGKVVSRAGPSVAGTGAGNVRGRVYFYVPRQLQRPALEFDGDNLVIAFGSYGDMPPFHGWILAYNKTSIQLTGVFNDTPNGSDGGIWNSGAPVVVDSQGDLYTEIGNGTFDTRLNARGFPSRGDYGDSVVKLALVPGYKGPNGTGFKVIDYFTPSNQLKLEKGDYDLASSGVLLLPAGLDGPAHPDLLLASGKQGTIYVINRNNMGHFHSRSDDVVQELPGALTSSFDTPAFFDGTIYYAGAGDVARSFAFKNGLLVQTGQSTNVFPFHGASPVVSSDGAERDHLDDFRCGSATRVRSHELERRVVERALAAVLRVLDPGDHRRRACRSRRRGSPGGVWIQPVSRQSSSSMRARYPDKTGSVSSVRRTGRFCQNRVAVATIRTFRPLTRTSTDRTRSPSVSRICFSILRLTARSVSGPGGPSRSDLRSDAVLRASARDGCAAGGGPNRRPSIPGMRQGEDRCAPGVACARVVSPDADDREPPAGGIGLRRSRPSGLSSSSGSIDSGIVCLADGSGRL